MVVDDSAVVRGLLVRALETDPGISVVTTAMHGEAALRALRKDPVDIVILDVEMPVMDGLTALPLILAEFPRVRVVMASALTQAGAKATVEALALGAVGCVAKPQTNSVSDSVQEIAAQLIPLVKALGPTGLQYAEHRPAAAPVAPSARATELPRSPASHFAAPSGRVEVVVIGSSTGGPNALSLIAKSLPPSFDTPILIAQHMPAMFTPMLAQHLGRDGGRPASEGKELGPVEPGHIYVAPGDHHMELTRIAGRLVTRLTQAPPEHFCRPSVNPLFRTAARECGPEVLAVMLTGMGDDGVEATRDVVSRGGHVIAQDEATSVVWGMPGAIVREGLAHSILPLLEIAPAIARRCQHEVVRR
jgi:two-component system, chemotaxis family, protein-glutamate methylesterase/glutaminase